MMKSLSPYRLMHTLFIGLAASVGYGAAGAIYLYLLIGEAESKGFITAYAVKFRTLISLGLILGTALIVYLTQDLIPQTIESAFPPAELERTQYIKFKRRFESPLRSVTFVAFFVVLGFVIFSYARFPGPERATSLMIVAASIEYGLGVYVGRKLCYAGMMLHALLSVSVKRNLFKDRELDEINSYVHIVSTLTVIFVYVHVVGYYQGPFDYDSFLGRGVRPFLILPAIISTPVLLIFTFYPRTVLRKIYSQSIDLEIRRLRRTLREESLSPYEKRSHLMEIGKMSRDELRYSLQLTLGDLPIGITILIMLIQAIVKL